jgi:hypothetical protein
MTVSFALSFEDYLVATRLRGWSRVTPPAGSIPFPSLTIAAFFALAGLLIASSVYLALTVHWAWTGCGALAYFFFFRGTLFPNRRKEWDSIASGMNSVTFLADARGADYDFSHHCYQFTWASTLVMESEQMLVILVNGNRLVIPKRFLTEEQLGEIRHWVSESEAA